MGERRALDLHPELWAALDEGVKLRALLIDFYDAVYEDPRLSPFFHATTKEWAVDHQYAFLRQILTGDDGFFGDRPRNAHHWMVITDELFDHREALFASILRKHGVSEAHVADMRAIDESFRAHIVKGAPFPKKRGGQALPLDGWGAIDLSAGGSCDYCQSVLDVNAAAHYHLRTGKVACSACADAAGVPKST